MKVGERSPHLANAAACPGYDEQCRRRQDHDLERRAKQGAVTPARLAFRAVSRRGGLASTRFAKSRALAGLLLDHDRPPDV